MKKLTITIIMALLLIGSVFAGGVIIGGGLGIRPIFTTPTETKSNLMDKGIDGFTIIELDCNDVNYRCYVLDLGNYRKISFLIPKYDISQDPKVEYDEEQNQVLLDEKINMILSLIGNNEESKSLPNKLSEVNYKI